MAKILVRDIFRYRPTPQIWVGYVSADAGSVSTPTKATLTNIDYTKDITYDATDKEIDLEKQTAYKITVRLTQTGASSTFDIYDVTGSAVIASSPAAAGEKTVVAYFRVGNTAKSIAVRVNNQTANGTTQAGGIVMVEKLGKAVVA